MEINEIQELRRMKGMDDSLLAIELALAKREMVTLLSRINILSERIKLLEKLVGGKEKW